MGSAIEETDRRILRDLAVRSNRRGFARLASHLGLLALTGGLVIATRGDLLVWPAMALHGIVLIFLFAPLHECVHRTAFRSRALNDAVAFVAGLVVLLPPTWFRAFHFAHHRFTQDPKRDPELALGKPDRASRWLLHVSGLPTWWRQASMLARQATGRVDDPFVAARERSQVVFEARTFLAIYALIALLALAWSSPLPILLWVLPALFGQPVLRLYLLAEHTGCPLVADMLSNSRTTLTTKVVRWLAWNMPFHAEHHAYPALPFHALPEAHQRLRPRRIGHGYVRVNLEIARNLGRSSRQAGSAASVSVGVPDGRPDPAPCRKAVMSPGSSGRLNR